MFAFNKFAPDNTTYQTFITIYWSVFAGCISKTFRCFFFSFTVYVQPLAKIVLRRPVKIVPNVGTNLF